MTIVAIVDNVVTHILSAKAFTGEFTPNVKAVVNNDKVTDHHAILPTMQISKNLDSLTEQEKNILLMICVRLISAVSEKHTFIETTVTVECNKEIFTSKGKIITVNGWKQVEETFTKAVSKNKKTDSEAQALPKDLTGNQQFTAETSVREGFTSPPKHYTEDTLLSAMETAGAEGVTEDIERKGLGTPATRAGIIENLVKNELLVREKKNLLPTEKGINLIKILPEQVKSPLLTAGWENNLKRMERGEVEQESFMSSIESFVKEVVDKYNSPENTNPFASTSAGEIIGACPRCKAGVFENSKAYSCRTKDCGFVLFKDNRFFASQKKKFTKDMAKQLLTDGFTYVTGFTSAKTDKKYNATVILDDKGEGYPGFKLEFKKR